jgi:hypothetical protein
MVAGKLLPKSCNINHPQISMMHPTHVCESAGSRLTPLDVRASSSNCSWLGTSPVACLLLASTSWNELVWAFSAIFSLCLESKALQVAGAQQPWLRVRQHACMALMTTNAMMQRAHPTER